MKMNNQTTRKNNQTMEMNNQTTRNNNQSIEMNNQIMTAINCGLDVDVRTVINTDLLEKRINSWT